jgi:hypothetical protein
MDLIKEKNDVGTIIVRILLSPFIFLWGCFMLAAGTFFPLCILVPMSIYGVLFSPFIWIFRKTGSNIKNFEPFMSDGDDYENNRNITRDHFYGATIHIWGAFAVAYTYISTGKIFTLDD